VRFTYVKRRLDFQKNYALSRPPPRLSDYRHLSAVKTTDKLVCLGSSTGGTVALEYLFQKLPAHLPPMLIVQHMPPNFTRQFAQRLNGLSPLEIKEAEDGEILSAGTVYIAPGGLHLTVERRGAILYTRLTTSERVQFQRPSADVLFRSAAEVAGRNVIAALLTGMGKDGADGLLSLFRAGAFTVAQDEASSVVWGMPRAAIELGAASKVLPLDKIAEALVDACRTS